MKKTSAVVVFAKAPLKGFVKTRLKGDAGLSDDETLELYRAFLADTLLAACKSKTDAIYLTYYPESGGDAVKELVDACLGKSAALKRLKILPQEGRDFDERFTNAVKEALNNADSVVVIGSDLPHIQPKTIDAAQDFLNRKNGMVIGPSREGGAYLVGVSKPLDFTGAFTKGIEMENILSIAKTHGMPLLLLDELTDMDVSSDLVSFICNMEAMKYASLSESFFPPENTIKAIKRIGLLVEGSKAGERNRRLLRR